MSQQRQFQMVAGSNPGGDYNDKTFTKIFVGGLAWVTQRDTMRRYFEQFGEILEAVVITDKNTGRSKGYGFVTFKDPESAMRACQNPSPVIDGRRANCNLASLGAQKTRSSTNPQHGPGRFRLAPAGLVAPPAFQGSSSTLVHHHQPSGQYTFPYSTYGYSGYTQDILYPLNYYNVYGGQQFSPYHTAGTSGAAPGMFHSLYPIYAQYAQTSQAHGFGVQYHPQMVQYPYLPQHYGSSTGSLSLPSLAMATTSTGATTTSTTIPTTITPPTSTTTGGIGAGAATTSQQASSGSASEQNSSTKE
ncbi:putative RNA-binding region-containing protein [Tripterygium wilfordii]|uniref:Putative RNA-binding region-containing protein n=1 Tax=Tripterygium wilfordii TaxID=458696 RepID=A0A7J7CGV1_TRIWF|nr:RNA-binding protein 24-B-like [Tripterygium wilfordii]KAF5733266.1 putative RNA-binding region-containing protein [Tripterygium wilfordii]